MRLPFYLLILSTIFLIFSYSAYSQNIAIDSIQIKSKFQCNEIANNSQYLIINSYSHQFDSILKIATIWSENCGQNECNQRIKILAEIEKGKPVDLQAFEYFLRFKDDFGYRLKISKNKKHKELYEKRKSTFCYIPINETFDTYTKNISKEKTYQLDNRSSAYLLCLLWSQDEKRFKKLVKSRYFRQGEFGRKIDSLFYTRWMKGVFLTYHGGYWFPLDKMQQTFKPDYELGFSFGRKLRYNIRIDFDFSTKFLRNAKKLEVFYDDTLQTTSTKYGFTGGILLTKQINFNYKSGIDIRLKAMKTGISTNLYRIADNITMDRIYYTLESYNFSIGLALQHRLFYHNTLFYFIDYNYAPFQKDKRLITNIGSTFLSSGLGFQF